MEFSVLVPLLHREIKALLDFNTISLSKGSGKTTLARNIAQAWKCIRVEGKFNFFPVFSMNNFKDSRCRLHNEFQSKSP